MNEKATECLMCGSCCIAFSVSSLNKRAGERCPALTPEGKCGDYENRPEVCRAFKADSLCVLISTLTGEEKLAVLGKVYGETE